MRLITPDANMDETNKKPVFSVADAMSESNRTIETIRTLMELADRATPGSPEEQSVSDFLEGMNFRVEDTPNGKIAILDEKTKASVVKVFRAIMEEGLFANSN